jgi:hypothetical protein
MPRSCDLVVHLASTVDASWRHYSRQQGNDVPFASRYGYGIPITGTYTLSRSGLWRLPATRPLCMLVGKGPLLMQNDLTFLLPPWHSTALQSCQLIVCHFNQPTSHSPQALLLTAAQHFPPTSSRLHFHVFALKECSTSFLVGVVQLQLTKPLLVLKRLNLSCRPSQRSPRIVRWKGSASTVIVTTTEMALKKKIRRFRRAMSCASVTWCRGQSRPCRIWMGYPKSREPQSSRARFCPK